MQDPGAPEQQGRRCGELQLRALNHRYGLVSPKNQFCQIFRAVDLAATLELLALGSQAIAPIIFTKGFWTKTQGHDQDQNLLHCPGVLVSWCPGRQAREKGGYIPVTHHSPYISVNLASSNLFVR